MTHHAKGTDNVVKGISVYARQGTLVKGVSLVGIFKIFDVDKTAYRRCEIYVPFQSYSY